MEDISKYFRIFNWTTGQNGYLGTSRLCLLLLLLLLQLSLPPDDSLDTQQLLSVSLPKPEQHERFPFEFGS